MLRIGGGSCKDGIWFQQQNCRGRDPTKEMELMGQAAEEALNRYVAQLQFTTLGLCLLMEETNKSKNFRIFFWKDAV